LRGGHANDDDEADEASARAYTLARQFPAIATTRGAVLIERGHLDEGMALLRTSIASQSEPAADQANSSCYLAIAEAAAGNHEKAHTTWETARTLDPTCDLLSRATPSRPETVRQWGCFPP
jgi:predicted Zn-dependent protease